jgi:hypothetical protein
MSQGFVGEDHVPVWCVMDGSRQFRIERYASDCDDAPRAVRDNRGWYTTPGCDETARGIVAYAGRDIWLAGYEWSSNGERVWFHDWHDSQREAAMMADDHAQEFAERECEYQTRWQEARELHDTIEEKFARLRECLALRHKACMRYVRCEARECIEAIRAAREALATDYREVEV